MPTLVYRYGLHAPHEGADIVREQMRAAHRYRNMLVEIERGRRAAVRELEQRAGLTEAERAVETARAEREAAHASIARHRARSRKRDEPAEMRARLAAARDAERQAVRGAREARRRLQEEPSMFLAAHEIAERAKDLAKNAYAHSGAYWGQRALVDDAAGASFADTAMYDDEWQPSDPGFARWTGDSAVGHQIMGGLSAEELHACDDTRLRLRAPDVRAWSGRCADKRRYGSTAELRLRVGSEGRDPVWAAWVCDMDRPLPEGARVVWATVHARQRGPHSEWSLSLTLDVPVDARAGRTAEVGGSVALDLGWRQVDGGLRVAAWRDEHGGSGTLVLDRGAIDLLRSPEAIRAERDLRFDGARLGLRWWIGWQPEGAVPEWLLVAAREMGAWRAHGRLERLWQHWSERRFAGDERIYGLLTAWRWRDRDLWSAEEKNRTQGLRRRRDVYRVFAADLARRYDTIVLEQFDLRAVARREKLSESRENETSRSNRQLASVSELRTCVEQSARSRGRVCVSMPAADTTRTCPACGLVEKRDAAAGIVLVCECGHAWDQDDGAAEILLGRWRERPGDARVLGGARKAAEPNDSGEKSESRWERARRLRAEKEVKLEAARKAVGMVAE